MALRPPADFVPPAPLSHSPSERELRALWDRHEAARRERERAGEWRQALEQARRGGDEELRPAAPVDELPAYLRDRLALGSHARNALRPVPRDGRVIAAGVDTLSPCWYAEPGSPLGAPIASVPSAGLRRLDVAVDLCTDSAAEGLALLECVGAAPLGAGKLAAYRAERCVESVLIKSRAGRTLARVYDKGAESGRAPRGRWLRLEAQWRLPRGARIGLAELDSALLQERFKRRFEGLWQAAGGFRLGGLEAVTERISDAVASGQLQPSRARSVAGYLLLRSAGVCQGADRTAYELERECRELGLSVSLLQAPERRVDVAAVLDECLAPEVWR